MPLSSSPRTVREDQDTKTSRSSSAPTQDQQCIRYGVITEVNKDTSQVKVRLFTNADKDDIDIVNYNPILNSLSEIHLLYGELRQGLYIRFFYKGKEDPKQNCRGLVEIIADEESDFLRRLEGVNVIDTGPYKLMSGGLLG
jgi:hypothetical protein